MKKPVNNVNTVKNNLFILNGQEEYKTPYGWDGMPDYVQEDDPRMKDNLIEVYIGTKEDMEKLANIGTKEDMEKLAKMLDQTITDETKCLWHPFFSRDRNVNIRWVDEDEEGTLLDFDSLPK
jgi:hypothetical protein